MPANVLGEVGAWAASCVGANGEASTDDTTPAAPSKSFRCVQLCLSVVTDTASHGAVRDAHRAVNVALAAGTRHSTRRRTRCSSGGRPPARLSLTRC